MELTVVILNYNVKYFLQICLESVFKAISNLSAEVIVVDNASSDGSLSMVKTYFPEVVLIANKTNVGFAKANNQAVKIAKGKYVCILNPDTVVAEDTFKNSLDFYKSKDKIGLLGVQLIDGKGQFLPESKRNLPTPKVSFFKIFGSFFSSIAPYYSVLSKDDIGQVEVLVGAFMLCEKSYYKELGGFDERYFMYGEDIDLSCTFKLHGLENYYLGTNKIIHFKGESSLKDKVYRKRFYGAMKLFYSKYFKTYQLINGVVFIGIKLASLLKQRVVQKTTPNPVKVYLISDDNILQSRLSRSLNKDIQMILDVEDCSQKNSLVFLDTNFLTFEVLLEFMNSNKYLNLSYRVISKTHNFAVGSDLSSALGSVILIPDE